MVYNNDSPQGLGDLLAQRSLDISFDNNSQSFFPRGSFDDLFTSEAVFAALWPPNEQPSVESTTANAKRRESLVAFVLKNSKTTFAILLSFLRSGEELRQAVRHFRDARLDDSNLPITSPDIKARIFYKPGNGNEYRQPWSGFREKNFCDIWQWRFTAPVFHHGQSFLGLHQETILPFTKVNSRGIAGSGKFGDVHEVTVHPAHIGSILPTNRSVSIKKLYRPETEDQAKRQDLEKAWRQEVFAHEELVKCEHRNIIKFIAGITKGNERYLMCEWANGGNLREFWTRNEKPVLTRTLIRDVIIQLQGIAGALSVIHSKGFRHSNMKPENIVRQEITPRNSDPARLDVGELKLCDMGLTKYHDMATEFCVRTDTMIAGWRYEPPESLLLHQPWSRRFDIWSFGCIILEFIVWMLEGSKGLERFNSAIVDDFGKECRYFKWEKKRKRQTVFYVHLAVEQKMKALSSQHVYRAGKSALGDLLAIVETKLLVVDLTSANPKIPMRAAPEDLKEDIDKIVERGSKDPAYWFEDSSYGDIPSFHPAMAVTPAASGRRLKNVKGQLTTGRSSPTVPLPARRIPITAHAPSTKSIPRRFTDSLSSVQTYSAQPQDNKDHNADRPSQQNTPFSNKVKTLEASAAYRRVSIHPASIDTGKSAYQTNSDDASLPIDAKNAQQQQIEQQGVEPNIPLDNANTVYSVDSTVVYGKIHTYILEFANAVARELFPRNADNDPLELLSAKLPDAIRAFALRIGGKNSTQAHREIMCLTHKSRRIIANEIRRILEQQVPGRTTSPDIGTTKNDSPLAPLRMDDWHQRPDNDQEIEATGEDETHMIYEPDEDKSEAIVPETGLYMSIVSSNVAYRWLMANLKRDVGLMIFDDSATTRISNKLLSSIQGPRRMNRHKTSDTKIVTLTMKWNPKEFLRAQFSDEDLTGHTISDIITLTGSSQYVFASSCRNYLNFLWPNTGREMASLIDKVSSNSVGSSHSYDLEDGSQVTAMIVDSELQVRIDGGIHTIVEIAEQLGWLGSALQNSPYESGIAGCEPYVSQISQSPNDLAPGEPQLQEYSFRFEFNLSRVRYPTSELEGERWHKALRSHTIAMTYPILRRQIDASGLELSPETIELLTIESSSNTVPSSLACIARTAAEDADVSIGVITSALKLSFRRFFRQISSENTCFQNVACSTNALADCIAEMSLEKLKISLASTKFKSKDERISEEWLHDYESCLKEDLINHDPSRQTRDSSQYASSDDGVLDITTEHLRIYLPNGGSIVQLHEEFHRLTYPSFASIATRLANWTLRDQQDQINASIAGREILLSTIAELAHTVPDKIELKKSYESSWTNGAKLGVEHLTGRRWYWGPWEPPCEPLPSRHARLEWICTCGDMRWAHLPLRLAKQLQQLVGKYSLENTQLHGNPPINEDIELNTSSHQQVRSGTQIRNTGQKCNVTNPGSSSRGVESADNNTSIESDGHQQTGPRYISLVVSSDRHRLGQLPVNKSNTQKEYDTKTFAQDLRSKYNELRGFWRGWFSISRFSHCDFVKFEKYCPDEYAHRGLGLPESKADAQKYWFNPRPPNCTNPPISREEFKHIFYFCPCEPSCEQQRAQTGATRLPFFTQSLISSKYLREYPKKTPERIPQRLQYFDKDDPHREHFWGLHAREEPSVPMALLYMALFLSPSIAFCFLYLFGFQKETVDLQNATVPFMTSLTFISMFLGWLAVGGRDTSGSHGVR